MSPPTPAAPVTTAPFDTGFFPQHLALVTVGDNLLPMGYYLAQEDFATLGERWQFEKESR